MKKVIWTLLATVSSAAATALTVRGLSFVWKRVMKEPPPMPPLWAKLLVGGARKGVENALHPKAV